MKSSISSRRRSSAEMFPLVESYLSSELSRAAFCQLHDISLCVFSYWYGKYRKSQDKALSRPSNFVSLQVSGPSASAVMELELGTGKQLRFFHYPDLKYLEGILSMERC